MKKYKLRKSLYILICIMIMSCVSCSSEPKMLETPMIFVSDKGDASWQEIKGATGYEYSIDGKAPVSVGEDINAIRLLYGESISVRAIGNGKKYLDSAWSETVTYAPENMVLRLASPKISANGNIVTWESVENAVSYEYILNDKEAVNCSEPKKIYLSKSDTLKVRAIGDNVKYLDSEFSEYIG